MITYTQINKDYDTFISPYAYPGIVTLVRQLTFEVIRDAVCEEFNIPFSDISSTCQKRIFIEPRQIMQTLVEKLTTESQARIGLHFHGRNDKCKDRVSVLHSKQKFYEHYQIEPEYRNTVRRILLKIGKNADYFDK